jgi:hypothetical protein
MREAVLLRSENLLNRDPGIWIEETGCTVRFLQSCMKILIAAVLFPVEVVVRGVRHKRRVTEVT